MWFKSWQGQKIYLFFDISRLAARPTQPLVQWVMRTFSPGVKWQNHEADHSFLTSANVKNEWSYTTTFHCSYALLYPRDQETGSWPVELKSCEWICWTLKK